MPKKLSIQEMQKRILEIQSWYPEVSFDLSTYTGYKSKIRAIDIDYGEWFPIFSNVYANHSKNPKRMLVEQSKRQTKSKISNIG